MTQKEKVLKHLEDYNQITSMEAFEKYKITRVGAVIDTLRKEGYDITTEKPKKGSYGIYKLWGTKYKSKPVTKREKEVAKRIVEEMQTGLDLIVERKTEWPD